MTGLIKGALICGGIIGAVVAAVKINDHYKENHDGKGIVEDAANAIEEHPVASGIIAVTGIVLATMACQTYTEAHRSPEYYELQKAKEVSRAAIYQARLEEDRRREEVERLEAEKRRQEDLDFKRQMPEGYWNYMQAVEDRKAREKEANSVVEAAQYVSDNELEATKYVSDNELEGKKVKASKKDANKEKEEDVA
jgi:hypothetical protein